MSLAAAEGTLLAVVRGSGGREVELTEVGSADVVVTASEGDEDDEGGKDDDDNVEKSDEKREEAEVAPSSGAVVEMAPLRGEAAVVAMRVGDRYGQLSPAFNTMVSGSAGTPRCVFLCLFLGLGWRSRVRLCRCRCLHGFTVYKGNPYPSGLCTLTSSLSVNVGH